MAEVGDKVIVKVCKGEFRGVVRMKAYDLWTSDFLYQVSGDEIITNTHDVEIDNGRKLVKGKTCSTCKIRKDCAFVDILR